MGVDRFFLIDNDSDDNTVDLALTYQNVHVFQTDAEYKNHWLWMEFFLEKYGKGHWCLVVDVDELLCYPQHGKIDLKNLCHFMASQGNNALKCLLLDMYSRGSITNTKYQPGTDPLLVCDYFDPSYESKDVRLFDRRNKKFFNATVFTGGMRERVFGKNLPYHLSKIPLFMNSGNVYLTQGMHALNNAAFSCLQGVVFHIKFMDDFIEEAKIESAREQHFNNATLYKVFQAKVTAENDLSCFYNGSKRFEGEEQMLALGIMKTCNEYEDFVGKFDPK